jgi:hypothetical protein
MSGMNVTLLTKAIARHFPTQPVPSRVTIGETADDEEIAGCLRGVPWPQVPNEALRQTIWELNRLTDDAFAYYLPSYLTYCCLHRREQGDVADRIVAALAPDYIPRASLVMARYRTLSPRAAFVTLKWLVWQKELAASLNDESLEKAVDEAIPVIGEVMVMKPACGPLPRGKRAGRDSTR